MKQKLLSLLFFFGFILFSQAQGPPPPCGLSGATACEEDGDGFGTFDLVSAFPFSFCNINPNVEPLYYPLTFYESESDASAGVNPIVNPESYVNITPFSQQIWMRTDKIVPDVGTAPNVLLKYEWLEVRLRPTVSSPQPLVACQTGNLGYAMFDLSLKIGEILSGQSGYTVRFHETYEDAINLQNSLDLDYTNVVPNSQTIYASVSVFSSVGTSCLEVVELDLIVDGSCEDIAVQLIQTSGSPRPGFNYRIMLSISNLSFPTVGTGTVEVVFDENIQYESFAVNNSSVSATETSNGLNVNFSDLTYGESVYVEIEFTIPVNVALGTVITNSASYVTSVNDINPINNNSNISAVVIGAFDPNDKMESHGPEIVYDDFVSSDEYLYYTIRFQNVGTAEAISIRIEDELDDQLDESTFLMLESSHNHQVVRTGKNLEWYFNNINLPAEQDDADGSIGYVYFRIKPKAGYSIGDIIPNIASIYF
ncbi:MAG: hypothetical protein AAF901_11755, partial [Bacteroidota bacterium]